MSASNSFTVIHFQDGSKHDFNILDIPTEIMMPLVNAIKWEHQKRLSAACAPDFREQRAQFIDKVIQANKEKGLNVDPTQLFIDFK